MSMDKDIRECEMLQSSMNKIFLLPHDNRNSKISSGNKKGHELWKTDLQQVEEEYVMSGQEGHIQHFKVVVDQKQTKEEIHKNYNKFNVMILIIIIF